MKTKDQVRTDGRAVFYAVLYPSMRQAALECGYALALHGSMESDLDMIAVAWTENAKPVEELAAAINNCIGQTVWKDSNLEHKWLKPHGRIVYSLSIMGDYYIDLSIIPPRL